MITDIMIVVDVVGVVCLSLFTEAQDSWLLWHSL